MYTALYRKWRPLTFDDVVAQPHITTTLKNQIISGKTAHAYLFTGSRGTGKTTCARIFAKAVNCEHTKDGNPCLECSVCHDAENEALSDIIEIDAASNNGVDDVRDLRDGAVYSPERCKYKVYIIDEVHMLSTNAFNALLKIIEEPPPYVKFILATTEVHKVLPTILSRCQRFDFRRIMPDDIAARLKYIAGEEKIALSDDAASLIARLADGGMRDALSLLDQCIAFSEDVSLDTVSAAAGIAGRDYLFDIISAIVSYDAGKALSVVDALYGMSKDIARLCEELIFQFRNLMLVKSVPEKTNLLACLPDEQKQLKQIADTLTLDGILEKLTMLQECNERLASSLTKRVEFEMCLVKLCTKKSPVVVQPAVSQMPQDVPKPVVPTFKAPEPPVQSNSTPEQAPPEIPQQSNYTYSDDVRDCTEWCDVLDEFSKVNPAVTGALAGSTAFTRGNTLFITATNPFFLTLFKKEDNRNSLGQVICRVLGKPYLVRARGPKQEEEAPKKNHSEELLDKAKENGIPVGIE